MLQALVNSELLNPAFWVAVAGTFWLMTSRPRWVTSWLLWSGLVLIGLTSLGAVLVGLYRSYTVPRDVLQDIVAAQEYLAGRPIQTPNMNLKMRAAIEEDGPRRSMLWWSPGLAEHEAHQRDLMLQEHWVQAHPPLVTLITAQWVRLFGVLGTQVVYAIANIGAIFVMVLLTYWKFRLDRWQKPGLAAMIAVIGWSAVVSSVRLQQLSLPLAGLLTISWVFHRRGKDGLAGCLIGLAVGLKLIPGVLLLPLLIRYRRGFIAALGTMLLILGLLLLFLPVSDLLDYRATASQVVEEYATYPANESLLGVYARCAQSLGGSITQAKLLWLVSILLVGLAWAYVLFHHPRAGQSQRAVADTEWAVGLGLIPLLSPVAWDHYQVFLLLPIIVIANKVRESSSWKSRCALAIVILLVTVPDKMFLSLSEWLNDSGWHVLTVWLVLPLRTLDNLAIVGWTGYLLWQRTSNVRALHPAPCDQLGDSPRFLFGK